MPRIDSVKVPIYVSVLNNGSVPAIPDNVAVETHVRVDGGGIHPMQTSGLPSRVFKYAMLPRIMRFE